MRNMKQPRTMPCIITRKILGWHSVQMIEPGGHVMNFRQAQTTTAQGTSLRSATGMRLSGYWLVLARVVWIAVVVLILALFVASIPAFTALLQNACTTAACYALIPPYSMKQYQAAGLSVNFVLIYSYALTVFALLAFLAIGAVIFWLKSHDFMAFYTSFALVTFAMTFNSGSLLGLVPAWWLPIQIISFFGSVAFGTFLYLFPNGRFVPRWMRWLVGGWVIYSGVVYFFPDSWLNTFWFTDLLFAGLLVSLLMAQVYRYRQVSSQVERQQTKWVVFGMSICVIGLVLVNLLYFSNPLSLFHSGPLSDLIVGTVLQVFVLSTLVAFFIAQPLRKRIQAFIDRRFYRSKYDTAKTLAAFSATLRHEVDLDDLNRQLVAVVQETMQPTHVWLWVRPPAHDGTQRAPWRATPPVSSEGS